MPSNLRSKAEVEIRPARPDDAAFIEELAGLVFLTYGSYDRYLADWFRSDTVRTYIGELDEERAGFFMLIAYPHPTRRGEAVADLLAIAVSPERQTRGMGTALLKRSLLEARQLPSALPIHEIRLSVAETNERGKRLFGRHGFRFDSDNGLYPAGQRAFQMIRRLSES